MQWITNFDRCGFRLVYDVAGGAEGSPQRASVIGRAPFVAEEDRTQKSGDFGVAVRTCATRPGIVSGDEHRTEIGQRTIIVVVGAGYSSSLLVRGYIGMYEGPYCDYMYVRFTVQPSTHILTDCVLCFAMLPLRLW